MRRKICFLITYIVFLLFFSGCSPREEVFLLSKNENGFIVNLKDVSIDDFREERFNLDKKTLFNIDYSLTNGDVTLVVGDSNSEIIDIYKLSWIGNISFLLDEGDYVFTVISSSNTTSGDISISLSDYSEELLENETLDLTLSSPIIYDFKREDIGNKSYLTFNFDEVKDASGYEIVYIKKKDGDITFSSEEVVEVFENKYTFELDPDYIIMTKVRAFKYNNGVKEYSLFSDTIKGDSLALYSNNLPSYRYTGDNLYFAYIYKYLEDNFINLNDGEIVIPVFNFYKIKDNESNVKVYGDIYLNTYIKISSKLILRDSKFFSGEFNLNKISYGFEVSDSNLIFEEDGGKYIKSLICDDEFSLDNFDKETAIIKEIKDYIENNTLDINFIKNLDGREIRVNNFEEDLNIEIKQKPKLSEVLCEETLNSYMLTVECEKIDNISGYEFELTVEDLDTDEITNTNYIIGENGFSFNFFKDCNVEFRVRYYREENGDYVYSDWSNISGYKVRF